VSPRESGPSEGHFLYLLASLLLLLVATPFLFDSSWGRILLALIGASALLSATYAVSRRRRILPVMKTHPGPAS
jgi:hypothetical protein